MEIDPPSKSARKRASHDAQDLGEALLELPEEQLDAIGMDERLRDALRALRAISSHGARKRQAQYVGKLMRDIDVTPFQRAIAARRASHAKGAAAMKKIEQWRDRLLAGDEGLNAWVAEHPTCDTPRFRGLVRDARRDRGPDSTSNSGAFRELFREIKSALDRDGQA